MKNIKLEKSKVGWFLTIGDDTINNRWSVSSLELWALRKVIDDNRSEIFLEIEKQK